MRDKTWILQRVKDQPTTSGAAENDPVPSFLTTHSFKSIRVLVSTCLKGLQVTVHARHSFHSNDLPSSNPIWRCYKSTSIPPLIRVASMELIIENGYRTFGLYLTTLSQRWWSQSKMSLSQIKLQNKMTPTRKLQVHTTTSLFLNHAVARHSGS